MAKRKKSKTKSKRAKRKVKTKKSNVVPLQILEARLGRLNGIVKRRGGDAYTS